MKDVVKKVLDSLGLDKESHLYLQIFKKLPHHKFAVIKLGGYTLTKQLNSIAEDIAFFSKLGLTPIIVHGGGEQIDHALKKAKVSIKKIDGFRITDKKTMSVVKSTLYKITKRLVNLINKKGGHAINANGIATVTVYKKPLINGIDLGFVGEIKDIDTDTLKKLCASGNTPVLCSVGHSNNVPYNINADTLASEIVKRIRPKKFILTSKTGGVLDNCGKIISSIDIETDLPQLIKTKSVDEGMLLKLCELKKLLETIPSMVVEICSAENILKELFTVKGSGTFIRYGGNFLIKKDFKTLNTHKIKMLLEESFHKTLVSSYFNSDVDGIILEKDYSGIAVIKKIDGSFYLDKFAIEKSSQGNGLGKTMWHLIMKKYPSLIWRSSIDNPVNSWYLKQSDGTRKSGVWMVFWYNIDAENAFKLAENISKIPSTMVKI